MTAVAVLAESVSPAEHLGLEPQRFLEAIECGAVAHSHGEEDTA